MDKPEASPAKPAPQVPRISKYPPVPFMSPHGKAALTVQKHMRGTLARIDRQRKAEAAVTVQSHVRGYLVRKRGADPAQREEPLARPAAAPPSPPPSPRLRRGESAALLGDSVEAASSPPKAKGVRGVGNIAVAFTQLGPLGLHLAADGRVIGLREGSQAMSHPQLRLHCGGGDGPSRGGLRPVAIADAPVQSFSATQLAQVLAEHSEVRPLVVQLRVARAPGPSAAGLRAVPAKKLDRPSASAAPPDDVLARFALCLVRWPLVIVVLTVALTVAVSWQTCTLVLERGRDTFAPPETGFVDPADQKSLVDRALREAWRSPLSEISGADCSLAEGGCEQPAGRRRRRLGDDRDEIDDNQMVDPWDLWSTLAKPPLYGGNRSSHIDMSEANRTRRRVQGTAPSAQPLADSLWDCDPFTAGQAGCNSVCKVGEFVESEGGTAHYPFCHAQQHSYGTSLTLMFEASESTGGNLLQAKHLYEMKRVMDLVHGTHRQPAHV